jgi:hypothetical protein
LLVESIQRTPRRVTRISLQLLSNWITVPESHDIAVDGLSTLLRNGNAVGESIIDIEWPYENCVKPDVTNNPNNTNMVPGSQ